MAAQPVTAASQPPVEALELVEEIKEHLSAINDIRRELLRLGLIIYFAPNAIGGLEVVLRVRGDR